MKERIRTIMQNEGLSMSEFADAIEVQKSSVSHVMNGRNKASLDFVQRILKRFEHINPDWLLFGKGAISRQKDLDLFSGTSFAGNEKQDKEMQTLISKLKQENQELKNQLEQRNQEVVREDTIVKDEDPPEYNTIVKK